MPSPASLLERKPRTPPGTHDTHDTHDTRAIADLIRVIRKGVLINACCPGADVAVYLALLPHDSHYNGLFFAKRQQIDY